MQVTDAMVAAAMNAYRVRPADLNTPHPNGMYIDHLRMRDALQAALRPLATGGVIRMNTPEEIERNIASFPEDLRRSGILGLAVRSGQGASVAAEPCVTEDGLDGPGVTDSTGSHEIVVNEPKPLGNVWDIAAVCDVSKETAQNWIDNRLRNGFPPLITRASSIAVNPRELFDLDEVQAWYRSGPQAVEAGDVGR